METTATPGWYTDPTGRHDYRYWTGTRWSPRVADGDDGILNPTEALAQATAADDDLLTDTGTDTDHQPPPTSPRIGDGRGPGVPGGHVPGARRPAPPPHAERPELGPRHLPSPPPPRRRGRGTVFVALLAVVAVAGVVAGLYFVLDPGEVEAPAADDTTQPDTTDAGDVGAAPGEGAAGEPVDELTDAVADYIVASSSRAVEGESAVCMAESIVETVGRERLEEIGVADGGDLLTTLERPEVESGLPPAMACLDDQQVRDLISSTLRLDVLQSLNARSPDCLVDGWFEGFGREKLTELYAVWAAPGSVELGTVLTPDELGILGDVIAECAATGEAPATP